VRRTGADGQEEEEKEQEEEMCRGEMEMGHEASQ